MIGERAVLDTGGRFPLAREAAIIKEGTAARKPGIPREIHPDSA
jgi:hypothetical protein